MHILIKDNYLNLDDVLVVSTIKSVGNEGAKFFTMTLKSGKSIEFFYHQGNQDDVSVSNGDFNFGTYAFFNNAYKDILNKLTNATELPNPR